MRLMEQSKHQDPKFSESFKDLAKYMSDLRKSQGCDTMSRFSSVGETFKLAHDQISNLTAGLFGNTGQPTNLKNQKSQVMSENKQQALHTNSSITEI